jgi:acetoin utilization deacetylase AcuC-like enzyme
MDIEEGKFHYLSKYINRNEIRGINHTQHIHQICEVADICCNGRVVSVLEGGYGKTPPQIPPPPLAGTMLAPEVSQPLEKSFFSECAMHHLKGLVDPYAE